MTGNKPHDDVALPMEAARGLNQASSAGEAFAKIEHALNHLRLTYLLAIAGSKNLKVSPAKAASAKYNGAFLALCGVRGHGITHGVQAAEDYLTGLGFDLDALGNLDWGHGLRFLEEGLRGLQRGCTNRSWMLAELVSMKPGFHEVWLHDDYPDDVQEDMNLPLGRILGVNRGLRSGLLDPGPGGFEWQTDLKFFLEYAPCAITEGPMVRRRSLGSSYFEVLCGIGPQASFKLRREPLTETFLVVDTWQRLQDEDSEAGLYRLIEDASDFVRSSAACSQDMNQPDHFQR